jgi:hypothetical protein
MPHLGVNVPPAEPVKEFAVVPPAGFQQWSKKTEPSEESTPAQSGGVINSGSYNEDDSYVKKK